MLKSSNVIKCKKDFSPAFGWTSFLLPLVTHTDDIETETGPPNIPLPYLDY